MITGNKGEWSEIYALFKLLSDEKLYQGDKDLNKIADVVYPIIKILRTEHTGDFEYILKQGIISVSGSGSLGALEIPVSMFTEKAIFLLREIQSNSSTFSVPEIEDFMREISCISLKAKSTSKTDISIIIHDFRTGTQPLLGFSIKSQLGSASTLLNAGTTTNFIYEIKGTVLKQDEINYINSIESKAKIKDRLIEIIRFGGSLEFIRNQNNIFGNNLILIDSSLPKIMASLLLKFYTTDKSSLKTLIKDIEVENPLNFDLNNDHRFYNYKIKRFLMEIALGMMPSKVWGGDYDATGGYLVVKKDGEIVCYHIYNKKEFEEYLLANTKFDTASSDRHGFGKIYEKDGKQFINLNLQIRFL